MSTESKKQLEVDFEVEAALAFDDEDANVTIVTLHGDTTSPARPAAGNPSSTGSFDALDRTKACRSYSASYPAALKKFRHSSMEKRPTISPNAFVTASKLRAARFRSKVLSLENAISIGFKSGE